MAAEAQQHRGLHRDQRLDHRHHLRVRRQLLGHFVGGLACRGQAAPHHLGVGEEVQVVDEVRQPVEAVGRRRLEVLAVGPGAGLVGAGGGGMVADARVDVRRHVGQMAGGGRQRVEPHRARQRAAGVGEASTVWM